MAARRCCAGSPCDRARQCLAVLGRNGAGKTTLLRCLTGLIPVSRGQVALDGADRTQDSLDARAGRRPRLRAPGPRDLPRPDGGGEPAGRGPRPRPSSARDDGGGRRSVPGAPRLWQRPGGIFGRATAAARDRARPGHAARAFSFSTSRPRASSPRSSRLSRRAGCVQGQSSCCSSNNISILRSACRRLRCAIARQRRERGARDRQPRASDPPHRHLTARSPGSELMSRPSRDFLRARNMVLGYFDSAAAARAGNRVGRHRHAAFVSRRAEKNRCRRPRPVPADYLAALDTLVPGPGPHFVTGPVYVRGAQPGDMLQVDILDLKFVWTGAS